MKVEADRRQRHLMMTKTVHLMSHPVQSVQYHGGPTEDRIGFNVWTVWNGIAAAVINTMFFSYAQTAHNCCFISYELMSIHNVVMLYYSYVETKFCSNLSFCQVKMCDYCVSQKRWEFIIVYLQDIKLSKTISIIERNILIEIYILFQVAELPQTENVNFEILIYRNIYTSVRISLKTSYIWKRWFSWSHTIIKNWKISKEKL